MGLDMWLRKKSKNIKIQIINSLNDESGYEEVMYWRKDYLIHEWFCENFIVENCEYVKLEKEDLLNLIEHLKEHIKESGENWGEEETDEKENEGYNKESINKLNEVIENFDWENEEIFYHAWW